MTVIRKIRPEETGRAAELIRESFMTVVEEFHLTPENCPSNTAFLSREKLEEEMDRGVTMFALFEGGEMHGFVALEKKEEGLFYIEKVAVSPRHRHQGYGVALLDVATAMAREQGGKIASIGIIEENTVLKDWYARYGFVHRGTKTYDHLPFTVGFMELDLIASAKKPCSP